MRLIELLKRAVAGDRGPAEVPGRAATSIANGDDEATELARRMIDHGNQLQERGDIDAAMHEYVAAAALAPGLARAPLNIGNALMARGDLSGAMDAFRSALELQPHYAGAHFNLGNAFQAAGDRTQARRSYERALAQDPGFVSAAVAYASVLDDLGETADALAAYRRALALAPEMDTVRVDLACVLARQGRIAEAMEECNRVLETSPDFAKARELEAALLKDAGRVEEAAEAYAHLLEAGPDSPSVLSGLLFTANYRADAPDPELRRLAARYGAAVAAGAKPYIEWPSVDRPADVLRVGFVSGDFRAHPVAYFLESVVAALGAQSPRRLELFAYSAHPATDAVTARLQRHFSGWRSIVDVPDSDVAKRIREDDIHILVDLSGHTTHSRLPVFAWKPAPLQVSWLGYFATTGLDAIDYFIADSWTLPEGEDGDFVEKIWRMPRTRLCFTPPAESVGVGPLPALSTGIVTFGCFNHIAKIGDATVSAWARVLGAVPASRLFVKSPPLADEMIRRDLLSRFAARGIDTARIITEGLSPRTEYLEAYGRVDIALDPFPYPGGTTSAEALWMGVPIVTMHGDRFLARQGSGLLSTLGLHDWIAEDADDYVRIATTHAGRLQELTELRAGLRDRALASPLFDATRFATDFADALHAMWKLRMLC